MRRLAVGQIEDDLVEITPAPAFGRIVALDDRMAGGMEMRGRVLVRGVVGAADVTAGAADPQVQPDTAALQAFLASERARRDFANAVEVGAALGHGVSPVRRIFVFSSAGLDVSPKNACSAATTWAPSPIAPPTRLTEPDLTSPTANTPGTEVSSCERGRPTFRSDCAPVTTNPPRSSVTPQPSSQPVAGSAPTNRNRLRISAVK